MRIDDNWCNSALAVLEGVKANGLITSLNKRYTYDELKQFDFIASPTTGVDHLDARDIPVISLAGEPGLKDVYATAEHTFALILSLVRKVPFAFEDVCKGKWDRDYYQGVELHGKTLGLVGYGRVAQQVERIAEAFGMTVIQWDWWETGYTLDEVLGESDIVSVHLSLTNETKSKIGVNEIGKMKFGAFLINTSRGAIINNEALYWALECCELGGAALDVLDGEPNIDQMLLDYAQKHENLIITPHIAGNTAESREKTQMMLAKKIRDYVHSHYRPTEEHYPSAGVCDGVI